MRSAGGMMAGSTTAPVAGSNLGQSVALTSSRIIAGAYKWNNGANSTITQGAILLFDHAGAQKRRVTMPSGADRSRDTADYGGSVGTSGDWVVVGAPGVNGAGGVYFVNLTEPLPEPLP